MTESQRSDETDLSRPFIDVDLNDVAPVTKDTDTEETEDDVMETSEDAREEVEEA